jgi:p-cumate 2,3-dioxygenase alpha subunit
MVRRRRQVRGRRAEVSRRDALLQAAVREFLQRGYDGTSLLHITRQVGGSRRAIYEEFGDKRGLFTAAVQEVCRGGASAADQARAFELPPEQALRIFGQRLLNVLTSRETLALYRMLMGEVGRFPALGRLVFSSVPESRSAAPGRVPEATDQTRRSGRKEPHPGGLGIHGDAAGRCTHESPVQSAGQTLARRRAQVRGGSRRHFPQWRASPRSTDGVNVMAAVVQPKQSTYRSRYLWLDRERGRFLVHRSAYTSPAIFEEEKRRILRTSWIVLGHDCELPDKGDFIVRSVVDRELIFNRDVNGRVNAFFNTCRHRGASICREPRGNRKRFVCAYHGWAYRSTGELFDQHAEHGYGERFKEGGFYDLLQVPRLEQRAGFWFVCFDKDAPPLAEYLAGAGDMLDSIAEHSAAGLQVVRGCHEYEIKANYKLICENSYDGYHLDLTHMSYVDYMKTMVKGLTAIDIRGRALSLGNGHACFELRIPTGRPVAQWLPVWGEEARLEVEAKKRELEQRLGPEKAERLANVNRNMVIFPNSIINDQQTDPDAHGDSHGSQPHDHPCMVVRPG